MAQEEQALLALIEDTLVYANRAERDLETAIRIPRKVDFDPDDEDEFRDAQVRLRGYVARMLYNERVLAERLGLPHLRQEIAHFEKKTKDLGDWTMIDEGDVYSPPLYQARQYLESLAVLVNPSQSSQLAVFNSILHHTSKIISDAKLEPANEVHVRNKILEVASYSFTDAHKEPKMPKSIKTYQGDIGVPSINAVAEYKFAKTKEEMKACLDGIYTDMYGYSGHEEWRHFFAVFYMKEHFFTQLHVEREFKKVGAKSNWTPIVLVGPTAQKAKKKGTEKACTRRIQTSGGLMRSLGGLVSLLPLLSLLSSAIDCLMSTVFGCASMRSRTQARCLQRSLVFV